MSIKDQTSGDWKTATKARDQERRDTLRSVLTAFTCRRTEVSHDLSDAEQLPVVPKQVQQRNDSIREYGKAGRAKLVAKGELLA
jgi:uncharacterized protein YqeY